MKVFVILFAVATCALAADPSQAEISKGNIHAKLYLPDAQNGYYQATRFDWSGVIASLEWKGHNYFGKWFDRYDPKINDAISGPVEEFDELGYKDAVAGGTFVKIGVGALRKPQDQPYDKFTTYPIVDGGNWICRVTKGRAEYRHTLRNTNGYAYEYRKVLRLTPDGMVLEHTLKNTGKKTIVTNVYEHNFYMLDGKPSGPDVTVTLPFAPRAVANLRGLAEIRGNQIVYLKELAPRETVLTDLEGYSNKAADYDIRVENRATGAGVRQTSDRSMSKLAFWSIRTTACPEAYIDLRVEPGSSASWRITYEFYEAKK
jgi:hypothetical protein